MVVDGDRNVKQENKRKNKTEEKKKKFLTFEISSLILLDTVIALPGKKEKVEMHNKVMTVEENMITTQK